MSTNMVQIRYEHFFICKLVVNDQIIKNFEYEGKNKEIKIIALTVVKQRVQAHGVQHVR